MVVCGGGGLAEVGTMSQLLDYFVFVDGFPLDRFYMKLCIVLNQKDA